jgi:rRNA maturation protein Rpf1
MWRAARALISCYYTTSGGISSPDEISNNLNNINDLKFYHVIWGNLRAPVAHLQLADIVSSLLPCRLHDTNQPMISTPTVFSTPRSTLVVCI